MRKLLRPDSRAQTHVPRWDGLQDPVELFSLQRNVSQPVTLSMLVDDASTRDALQLANHAPITWLSRIVALAALFGLLRSREPPSVDLASTLSLS